MIDLSQLHAAELTYPERGATRAALPAGYDHLDRTDRVGRGAPAFERAGDAVMRWQLHRRAGLAVVAATAEVAAEGAVVVTRLGPPWVGIEAPCRVVYVVDEQCRRGFGYGTLPGHPVSGEEAFIVELTPDGEVLLHIRAFSRAATRLTRWSGPGTRIVQRFVLDRYVRGLRRLLH